jgi:hypothetical protein
MSEDTGNGHHEPLSRVPVMVIITADHTGRVDVMARGPIKGKAGLLLLLDQARKMAEQMDDDDPAT